MSIEDASRLGKRLAQAARRRDRAIKKFKFSSPSYEGEDLRRTRLAREILTETKMSSLRPLLPAVLNLKGKPYTLTRHFPFEPFFRTRLPRKTVCVAGRQVSKCWGLDNVARKANGQQVKVSEIQVGDRLLSLDSDLDFVPGEVTRIWRTGVKPLFRIRTRLGAEMELTAEHRLRCLLGYKEVGQLQVGDRLAGVRRGGRWGNRKVSRSKIILTAYMIGDGCCGPQTLDFTGTPATADEFREVVTRFQPVLANTRDRGAADSIRFSKQNRLVCWLRKDGLYGKRSHEKFIPGWVFDLPLKDTCLFLSRLWATDGMQTINTGSRAESPTISYTSTSQRLARDVRSLLNKLGIPASIKEIPAGYRDEEGNYVECRPAFIVRVETRDGWRRFQAFIAPPGKPAVEIPDTLENNNRDTIPLEIREWIEELAAALPKGKKFTLGAAGLRRRPKYALTYRKLQQYLTFFQQRIPEHPRVADLEHLVHGSVIWDEIESIEPIGEQETRDFEIATTHNFVMDGIVSHNSTSLAARSVIQCATIPHFSMLFITPLYEMVRRFSKNYVGNFIMQSPVKHLIAGKGAGQSVLERSFSNHSKMQFSFAFLDAERTRGISTDSLNFDESQDLDHDLIPIIRETTSHSLFDLESHWGTPKTLEGGLEARWQDSSQAEWCIRCTACAHWNVPCLDHDLDRMIGNWHPEISEDRPGVICAKCGSPINPRFGRWVHRYPELRWKFAGYHVPQIIMPLHYADPEKWSILLAKRAGAGNMQTYQFYNEVLGESYDSGAKLVTVSELDRASNLPWDNKLEEAVTKIKRYVHRIVSIDWGGGGKDEVSFTTYAVLGMLSNGKIDVIFGHRSLTPHDTFGEAQLGLGLAKKFKCSHIVHDYGGAGAVRETIIAHSGFPYKQIVPVSYIRASRGDVMRFVPGSEQHARDHYQIDKSRSLVLICTLIKMGWVRFFRKDYVSNENRGLIRDFLALVEDKMPARFGSDVYTIIRNPKLVDDFAQAVNIGCCALFWLADKWPNISQIARFEAPQEAIQETIGGRFGFDVEEMLGSYFRLP